jgi:peptidoglycan/xylan/chitin deacetylase (PgdA/CDA1 family)
MMATPALLAAVPLAGLLYFAPQAGRYWEVAHLRRKLSRERTLVLTFDDGPGPGVDPPLLQCLAEGGAQATFFCLGARAEEFPQLASQIKAAGHEIACHGDAHVSAWRGLPHRVFRDVRTGLAKLSPWQVAPHLYRPPGGKMALPVTLALAGRRCRLGWWTVDSGDSWSSMPAAQTIVDAVCRSQGGVVLMHDHFRRPERINYVVTLTGMLLEAARREGMRVMPYGKAIV